MFEKILRILGLTHDIVENARETDEAKNIRHYDVDEHIDEDGELDITNDWIKQLQEKFGDKNVTIKIVSSKGNKQSNSSKGNSKMDSPKVEETRKGSKKQEKSPKEESKDLTLDSQKEDIGELEEDGINNEENPIINQQEEVSTSMFESMVSELQRKYGARVTWVDRNGKKIEQEPQQKNSEIENMINDDIVENKDAYHFNHNDEYEGTEDEEWSEATLENTEIDKKSKRGIFKAIKRLIVIGLIAGATAIGGRFGYDRGTEFAENVQQVMDENEKELEERFGQTYCKEFIKGNHEKIMAMNPSRNEDGERLVRNDDR